MEKRLFVFDFDYTLINNNTDTWVMGLRPELCLRERLSELRRRFPCWTDLMDHVFAELHQAGCWRREMLEHMGRLEVYNQALKALKAVSECEWADAIIVSDSNSVFIEHILKQCSVGSVVTEVFTNPAYFDESGRLHVQRFHSHNCPTCVDSPNMCKGIILRRFLNRQQYGSVVYVGDGKGDYCPSVSSMKEKDIIICRQGYSLEKKLANVQTDVTASVYHVNFEESLGDFLISHCLQQDSKAVKDS